jgi:hypothetical protein
VAGVGVGAKAAAAAAAELLEEMGTGDGDGDGDGDSGRDANENEAGAPVAGPHSSSLQVGCARGVGLELNEELSYMEVGLLDWRNDANALANGDVGSRFDSMRVGVDKGTVTSPSILCRR